MFKRNFWNSVLLLLVSCSVLTPESDPPLLELAVLGWRRGTGSPVGGRSFGLAAAFRVRTHLMAAQTIEIRTTRTEKKQSTTSNICQTSPAFD